MVESPKIQTLQGKFSGTFLIIININDFEKKESRPKRSYLTGDKKKGRWRGGK
jgi:hypothetical protein